MNNAQNPIVELETDKGTITLELFPDEAPKTVTNFLEYVDSGFYEDTIFHRVIPSFMIQGGGLDKAMQQKPTRASIPNEADNGLKNATGAITMARTAVPDSATAQFFINVKDNDSLNFRSKTQSGWGYCVFGKVIEGMDIVQQIEQTPTGSQAGHQDVPRKPIHILKAHRRSA